LFPLDFSSFLKYPYLSSLQNNVFELFHILEYLSRHFLRIFFCITFPKISAWHITFDGKRRLGRVIGQCEALTPAPNVAEQNRAEGDSPNTVLWSLAAQRAAYFYRFVKCRAINAPLSYYSELLYNNIYTLFF
jgi:hypothetical protein